MDEHGSSQTPKQDHSTGITAGEPSAGGDVGVAPQDPFWRAPGWPSPAVDPDAPAGIHWRLLAAALALGVLADVIRADSQYGLNVLVWTVALLAAAAAVAPWRMRQMSWDRRWLVLPIVGFASGFVWRDSFTLVAYDLLAVLVLLAVMTLPPLRPPVAGATFVHHVWGQLLAGATAAIGAIWIAFGLQDKPLWSHARSRPYARRLGKALLVAAPLVFAFGVLFASADAVFRIGLDNLFSFDADTVVEHLVMVFVWAWLAAGALVHAALAAERSATLPGARHTGQLAAFEIAVVGGLLNLLFLAFVLVQVRYLFGGAELVQDVTGLTYSEYARRGFFQLVTVASLVVPVLVVADWVRHDSEKVRRVFRINACVLIAMIAVVIASAIYRMTVYVEAYGMSELRFYALGLLAWLALALAGVIGTLLRGRRDLLPYSMIVAGIVVLGAINVINPDAYIARTNIERTDSSGHPSSFVSSSYDDGYVGGRLSADAVPVVIKHMDELPKAEQHAAATRMLNRWASPRPRAWLAWNTSRNHAGELVREHCDELVHIAGTRHLQVKRPCN